MTPAVQIKQTKAVDTAILIIVIAAVVVFAYSMYKAGKLFNSIGEGVGTGIDTVKQIWGGDKATRQASNALKNAIDILKKAGSKSPFDASFFTALKSGNKKLTRLTDTSAKAIAKQIKESVGVVKDDHVKMLSQFKKLKSQAQVADLSRAFVNLYGFSMLDWLYDKFDTKEQATALLQAIEYVNKLPIGFVSNFEDYNGELANPHTEAVKALTRAYLDEHKPSRVEFNNYAISEGIEPINFGK